MTEWIKINEHTAYIQHTRTKLFFTLDMERYASSRFIDSIILLASDRLNKLDDEAVKETHLYMMIGCDYDIRDTKELPSEAQAKADKDCAARSILAVKSVAESGIDIIELYKPAGWDGFNDGDIDYLCEVGAFLCYGTAPEDMILAIEQAITKLRVEADEIQSNDSELHYQLTCIEVGVEKLKSTVRKMQEQIPPF